MRQATAPEGRASFLERKGANAIRTDLLTVLRAPGLYDLDRFDLMVHSTLDRRSQEAITGVLHRLRDPACIEAAGLRGMHMREKGDNPAQILYSVTLYERAPQANLLRLQTDNFDQPFDVNRGRRLDLGSTAKLRTLITYLEIIARLHSEYASRPRQALRGGPTHSYPPRGRSLSENPPDLATLGLPFAAPVPSYATAIGSSGDRPDALAELMGIIVQDGVRYPTVSIERLHFAAATPYETVMGLAPRGEGVLSPEVAAWV